MLPPIVQPSRSGKGGIAVTPAVTHIVNTTCALGRTIFAVCARLRELAVGQHTGGTVLRHTLGLDKKKATRNALLFQWFVRHARGNTPRFSQIKAWL